MIPFANASVRFLVLRAKLCWFCRFGKPAQSKGGRRIDFVPFNILHVSVLRKSFAFKIVDRVNKYNGLFADSRLGPQGI